MLAAIGIQRGKPFAPDERTRNILDKAALTGWKMSKVEAFDGTPSWAGSHHFADRQWLDPNLNLALDLEWMRTAGDYRDLDARTAFFANYYSLSPAMISRVPGSGAKYLVAFKDGANNSLFGANRYTLKLPPKIPAANFWSVTLYDADTASGLANGQPFPSLGSRDKPDSNSDGSTDIYFGPTAPAGHEKNWLKTVAGKGYFVILRLYSPTDAAFDASWIPGDLQRAK